MSSLQVRFSCLHGIAKLCLTQRDEAIKAWLAQNNITNFAVLDDVPRFFSGYPSQWPQLIVCNAALGIADIQVQQRLQAWLSGLTRV